MIIVCDAFNRMLRATEYRNKDGEFFGVPSSSTFIKDRLWERSHTWDIDLISPRSTIMPIQGNRYADTSEKKDPNVKREFTNDDVAEAWWPIYLWGMARLGDYVEND